MDCIIIDDEPHAIAELSELVHNTSGIELKGRLYSIKAALEFLQENGPVNVIFTDINMPTFNGLDAAKTLDSYCSFVVFVTAHKEFALDAYGVNASGYLVKPVNYKLFVELIENLLKKQGHQYITNSGQKEIMFLKGSQKNSFTKIKYSDIIFIEAMLNYVKVHTTKGEEITYFGLKGMETMLKGREEFFRISKSVIISTHYLERVEGNILKLSENHFFSIGEKYRTVFHEYLRKRTPMHSFKN